MAVAMAAVELTRRVEIHHDDGSVVECEVTPIVAAALRRMAWAEDKRQKRRRKREVAATDLGVNLDWFPDRGGGLSLFLGESATWHGPGGWLVKVGGAWRCRGCGHVRRMPAIAYCLHCDRAAGRRG